MSQILRVFLNTDLRNAHDGLTKIAKDNGIDVHKLEPGEFIVFLNSEKNKLKLYTAHEVLAYLKVKTGKIDLRTLARIPQAFKASGRIQYEESLKEIIEEHLQAKRNGKH